MKTSYQLACFWCKTLTNTSKNISTVLCGNCVAKLSGNIVDTSTTKVNKSVVRNVVREKKTVVEQKGPYVPTGRPRGWHKKEQFEFNGVKYSYGKPVSVNDAV